jgi:Protein of unknown function (DUF3800)
MALFVYIDETGTTSLEDMKQPTLTLAAAIVQEDRVQPLAASLRQVAIDQLGSQFAGLEFHGNELWGGVGPWSSLDPPQLIATYRNALILLEEHEVAVAHASIDKPRLKARYRYPDNPYLLALQFLCEKIHDYHPRTLKVLIADESKEQEIPAIEMVADLQVGGPGVVPGKRLVSVIDTLHFVRSQASPGVQMADLIAFVLQRCRSRQDSHPAARKALQQFRAMISDATVTWRADWPTD